MSPLSVGGPVDEAVWWAVFICESNERSGLFTYQKTSPKGDVFSHGSRVLQFAFALGKPVNMTKFCTL
jgi:hypothetical protein